MFNKWVRLRLKSLYRHNTQYVQGTHKPNVQGTHNTQRAKDTYHIQFGIDTYHNMQDR